MKKRKCRVCGKKKTLDKFGRHPESKDQREKRCRECISEYVKNYYRTQTPAQKRRRAARLRASHLKRMYNMTVEDYSALLKSQGGVCAICRKPETARQGSKKRPTALAIDHCHETQKIRGLLCSNCNRGIGHLQESLAVLGAAMEYIKHHMEENGKNRTAGC